MCLHLCPDAPLLVGSKLSLMIVSSPDPLCGNPISSKVPSQVRARVRGYRLGLCVAPLCTRGTLLSPIPLTGGQNPVTPTWVCSHLGSGPEILGVSKLKADDSMSVS